MTHLSSNEMNAWLKGKEYAKMWPKVNHHLDGHTKDVVSANKFLTALAFHLYHNKLEDETVAREASSLAAKAVKIITEEHASLNKDTAKKVLTNANNLLFRGFLRDSWIEASKSVCASVHKLLIRLGETDLAAFFADVEEDITTVIKLSLESLKDGPIKEVKALLKANEMAREQLPLRTLGLYKLRLELLYMLVRHSTFRDFDRVKAAVLMAICFVRSNPTQNMVRCGCDRVFVVTVKFADFLAASARTGHLLDEELASARDVMLILIKAQVGYAPSPRSLKVWCHLFDNPRGDGDAAYRFSETIASELSRLVAKTEANATSKVLHGFATHCKFRLRYHRLREKMAASLEVEPRARKAEEEMEAVKDIGDVNPYINMSKEQEEEMLDLLLESLDFLNDAFANDDYFSHAFRIGIILGMIHSAAEYLWLSGYPGQARRAFRLLWKVARAYRMENYKLLAISYLLRCTRGNEEGDILREGKELVKVVDKNPEANEAPLWQLVNSVAWRDFYNSRHVRAFKLCRFQLAKMQDSKNTSSMDTIFKVAKADALTLMSHLRACPGTFVLAEGEDRMERLGPLEFANEAFRYSLSALKNASVRPRDESSCFPSLSRLSQLLMATRVHWQVLLLRYELFSRVRMPKEMRLYAKMAEEVVHNAAIPIRTAQSLLLMAEVDLLSEEVDQARAKLKGVARLLGSALTPAEVLSINSRRRENAKVENHDKILGASPSLRGHDVSDLPAWAESHDCDSCRCHECATFGPTQLACLQLINLQGVASHIGGEREAAARHFMCVRRLVSFLETRLEVVAEDGGEMALETAKVIVEALQWQFECYGRDEYVTKCRECLEEQLRWLRKTPGLASNLSGGILRTRLAHSALFLQLDDPLELTGVQEQLSKLTFLSPMPANSPFLSRQQPSPSVFKTPAAVQQEGEGDPKTKGSRITRRTATAAKAAPRKRVVPKPQK